MTKAEELFHKIAASLPDVQESKMFGALCVKAPNGKAGIMFRKEYMIFKLEEGMEQEALSLQGAQVFTPTDGRPMTGWVQLSEAHAAHWPKYAAAAMKYVGRIAVVRKAKKTGK